MSTENEKHSGPEQQQDKTAKQEQSDPQLTELRGFVDKSEDLEPTLTDGTKSPEKAQEEYKENKED